MNTLVEFMIYLYATVGIFLLGLAFAALGAEYVKIHRYDSEWCWRIANWLDSL